MISCLETTYWDHVILLLQQVIGHKALPTLQQLQLSIYEPYTWYGGQMSVSVSHEWTHACLSMVGAIPDAYNVMLVCKHMQNVQFLDICEPLYPAMSIYKSNSV